jgi:hypothetical protein
MVNTTQDFPQAKLKEAIYLRLPAGFEHKNKNGLYNSNETYTASLKHHNNGFSDSVPSMRDSGLNNQNLIHVFFSEKT